MISFSLRPEGKPADETWEATAWRIDDFDLLETYGMELEAGRYFTEDFSTDSSRSVVINEALARGLGWDDPIGKRLDIPGEIEEARVIGVLKDFHFESLHHAIAPLILYVAPRYENLSVRFRGEHIAETVEFLKATWERFDAAYPFDYLFLEEASARYYEAEIRLMQTIGLFALLAILIACLGLLGLAAFSVQQRTKEIGIRKLLGASMLQITSLLSRDFLKLVLLAFVLAVPISYFAMTRWLEGFAYRIDLGASMFLSAGFLALLIACLTIGFQTIRAGLSNPVDTLRYE
jgi:putative ABC transport system permease protein